MISYEFYPNSWLNFWLKFEAVWELRDWWCFSGEKCQFIEQLLVWVGGGIAGIKQNDISAAASDDRLISSLLCVCYKNVLTHLSTYILRASSSWSFWKTHREQRGDRRTKKERIICQNRKWVKMKERDHHYYLHLKGKNMKFLLAIWNDYLLALFAIQKQ